MGKITPCLWFDGNAEEAVNFYVGLLPDSRIRNIARSPADYPAGKAGNVLTVEFTLAGQDYMALNGGPYFTFNEAVSFSIDCADQAEVDRLWDAIAADGGTPGQCGWTKDRFGLSWQVVPRALPEMLASPDRAAAARAMGAMMEMTKLEVAPLERAFRGED
ncbi:MAG: VOC family protein [Alphaproteobacteria bacterium]|nr:MAG: VOC family protein [Alphaproteobacteria bacterium]